jgi:hypothetical protein
MAKLYMTNSNIHPQAWALWQSEDVLLAGAVLDIEEVGISSKHAALLSQLQQYWLSGHGLSDRTLVWLNDLRRANAQRELCLVNGHSNSYSLIRGEQKAQVRRRILEGLRHNRQASPLRYAEILERAETAAKSIPARDPLLFAA